MRKYAYDIVFQTLEQKGQSDILFHRMLKEHKEWDGQEKSFLKRLSFGTIERALELDGYLDQISRIPVAGMDQNVRTVLRLASYEIVYMDQVPESASCDEAAKLIRQVGKERQVGFVNGVLRNFLRKQGDLKEGPDWAKLSIPRDLMELMEDQYGKKTARKMGEYFLRQSGEVSLHVQTDRISTGDLKSQLENKGLKVFEGHYLPEVLTVTGVQDVAKLPGYKEGYFFVQDESSLLPVQCSGIQPGARVIDICAAPGGKTLHALQNMKDQGELSARDLRQKKVDRIQENLNRMKYTSATTKVWDSAKPDPDYKEWADVILADVPCSGIGIIGRKPEIKYRAMKEIKSLIPLQRRIAKAGLSMLRPGGVMIYSTCTINRGENEDNVRWLLEEENLELESLDPYLPERLQNKMTQEGMLQMLPGIMESDGFFLARLRKKV